MMVLKSIISMSALCACILLRPLRHFSCPGTVLYSIDFQQLLYDPAAVETSLVCLSVFIFSLLFSHTLPNPPILQFIWVTEDVWGDRQFFGAYNRLIMKRNQMMLTSSFKESHTGMCRQSVYMLVCVCFMVPKFTIKFNFWT